MAGVGLLHMLLVCLTSTLILATVSITDNGYDGIEIVIHENVAENLDLLKILEVRDAL